VEARYAPRGVFVASRCDASTVVTHRCSDRTRRVFSGAAAKPPLFGTLKDGPAARERKQSMEEDSPTAEVQDGGAAGDHSAASGGAGDENDGNDGGDNGGVNDGGVGEDNAARVGEDSGEGTDGGEPSRVGSPVRGGDAREDAAEKGEGRQDKGTPRADHQQFSFASTGPPTFQHSPPRTRTPPTTTHVAAPRSVSPPRSHSPVIVAADRRLRTAASLSASARPSSAKALLQRRKEIMVMRQSASRPDAEVWSHRPNTPGVERRQVRPASAHPAGRAHPSTPASPQRSREISWPRGFGASMGATRQLRQRPQSAHAVAHSHAAARAKLSTADGSDGVVRRRDVFRANFVSSASRGNLVARVDVAAGGGRAATLQRRRMRPTSGRQTRSRPALHLQPPSVRPGANAEAPATTLPFSFLSRSRSASATRSRVSVGNDFASASSHDTTSAFDSFVDLAARGAPSTAKAEEPGAAATSTSHDGTHDHGEQARVLGPGADGSDAPSGSSTASSNRGARPTNRRRRRPRGQASNRHASKRKPSQRDIGQDLKAWTPRGRSVSPIPRGMPA